MNSSSVPQHPRGFALVISVDPQDGLDSVKRLAQGHKADRWKEGSTQAWVTHELALTLLSPLNAARDWGIFHPSGTL